MAENYPISPAEKDGRAIVDEMIRLGYEKRRETHGDQFFDEVRSFYNFVPQIRTSNPSFRPRIRFPDLQMMVIQEAGDITDNEPIIYLRHGTERKQEREQALRAQWEACNFNLQFLHANIWALLCGTSFVQVSYRPDMFSGRGGVPIRAWNPENVVIDPWATSDEDWEYLILRVRMTYDEIARKFKFGWKLKPEGGISPSLANQMGQSSWGASGGQFDAMQLPPGPLRTVRVPGAGKASPMGNPIVDFVYLRDETRTPIEKAKGAKESPFPQPITVPKYPRGRLQVWADKYLMYDGKNPYRKFPLVPMHAMPPITGFWAPPPIRYVLPFQQLAETMTSQTVENSIRLNNGMIIINKSSGLNKDKVRGLPGEVLEVEMTAGKGVEILTPPAFPDQYVNMPDKFIMRMKELFGFTPERAGKVAAGNISSSLMDAAIEQSQKLLDLRARYYATTVKKVAELVFGTMLDYLGDTALPMVGDQGHVVEVPWTGALPDELEGWDIVVDPNSVKPVAKQARAKLGLMLRNMGAIDIKHLLEWVDAPDQEEILEALTMERAQGMAAAEEAKAAKASSKT